MNLDEMYPSKYLKVGNIPEGGQDVVIASIHFDDFKDPDTKETEHKPVLMFAGMEKGLILNKTNAKTIAEAFGKDTDKWTGKTIKLVIAQVEAFGEIQDAIRVRA